ncbi:hypothetical protein ACWGOE_01765 [Leucobacter chromiiresistens]
MAQSEEDELFEQIARANPDLADDDSKVIRFWGSDGAGSIAALEYEALCAEVGECLLAGGDFVAKWVPFREYPLVLQWTAAESSYRWAALRLFRMHPLTASQVMPHLKKFLYFAATLKPLEEVENYG